MRSFTMSRPALVLLASTFAATALACGSSTTLVEPGPAVPVVEYVQKQEILTPLPVRVRLPASTGAEHVVMLYRTWGSRGWRQKELSRRGQTWSGEVTCREVSTVTGDTKYFFVAVDDAGEVVAGSGAPDWPHVATVVGALPDGAQALPGGTLPLRCHDPADCPPDFPGCPSYAVNRRACRTDRDCGGESACAWDGYCGTPSGEVEAASPVEEASDDEQLASAIRAVKKRYGRSARGASPRAQP